MRRKPCFYSRASCSMTPVRTARRFIMMWIEAPGNALLGFADTLGIDDEMVAVIHWLSRHRRYSPKKFLLVPGVDEMLRQLHGRYPMAVVSARDEKGTRWLSLNNLILSNISM
jgi:phosphoglycolate phosphatase-like HAD superfamily hydrolase